MINYFLIHWNNVRNEIKKNHLIVFFYLFVVVQFLLIVIFNLTHLQYEAGFDSSAAMAQAKEIWNQKNIFLANWDYQSTLGLDSILIPASLIYGITHNIFVAYGIADCIGLLLCLYIFHDILKMLNISTLSRLITYIFLLTPYSLEPLGYMPMMFTGASYYLIKVLIPIMLIDILLKMKSDKPFKSYVFMCIIYFISVFFTGFSCGVYLFLCGILPLIVYELYSVICTGKIKNILKKHNIIFLISIIVYISGLLAAKLYGATSFTNQIRLCSTHNFTTNIAKCFVGIIELFGALPGDKVINVLSPYGINYLSHMGAFIIYSVILIFTLKNVKPLSSIFKYKKSESPAIITSGMVTCIIIVNLMVLILTDTTYGSDTFEFRYHLIPVVSGFFIIAIGLDSLFNWIKKYENQLFHTCIIVIIGFIWMLNNVCFLHYYKSTNLYSTSYTINDYIKNNTNYNIVYVLDDDAYTIDISRIARLFETDITYIDGPDIGTYTGWGATTAHDYSIDSLRHFVVVCTSEKYETLDSDLKKDMTFINEIDGYLLYSIEKISP